MIFYGVVETEYPEDGCWPCIALTANGALRKWRKACGDDGATEAEALPVGGYRWLLLTLQDTWVARLWCYIFWHRLNDRDWVVFPDGAHVHVCERCGDMCNARGST